MAKAIVNEDRCKGCALCTTVCPREIMKIDEEHLNKLGYMPAICIDFEKCTGCAMCARICPDVAITVEK